MLSDRSELVALISAGWVGITLAALSASLQLGLSPAFGYELLTVVTVMVGGHAVLGLSEGLLTLVGVRLLSATGIDIDSIIGEVHA